jgi:hypothetical protein
MSDGYSLNKQDIIYLVSGMVESEEKWFLIHQLWEIVKRKILLFLFSTSGPIFGSEILAFFFFF